MDGDTAAAGSSWLTPVTGAFLTNAAVVLGVAGGLVYGLVALGYDRFYRTLGIAPADVGLDQRQIIAQTAIALALLSSVLLGLFAVTHAVLSWFLHRAAPALTLAISVAIVAGAGPIALGVTVAPILFVRPFAVITAGVTAGVLGAALGTILLMRHATSPARRRALVLLWVAVLALSYGAGVQFATARMAHLARHVIAGRPIPPAGLTFTFAVHADPVCVREGASVSAALYLGERGDWIVLYQPAERRTVRRSRTDLQLSFIPPDRSPTETCA